MDKLFKLKENGTNRRTEIMAGFTTFIAMSYILFVNPGMFEDLGVVSFGAIYIATALSAVVGTLLIGLLANMPLAQAAGMGINAFFIYTVCFGLGFTYANALLFVLADGILFVILTVTGLRKLVFDSIPQSVKVVIPAGIGLFIALLGLQDSGIIINDPSTCLTLASFNLLSEGAWAKVMPLLVTLATLIAIVVMNKKGLKGAVLWSVLAGTVAYYLLGFTVPGFYDGFSFGTMNPLAAFGEFSRLSFGKVFTEGFDFSVYLQTHSVSTLVITILTTSLAFCLVDMFDTMGTLYAACRSGNMFTVNEKGEEEIPKMNRSMLADAIATCTGAVCGTSTVTTFVESVSGVAAGGRTGLASMVTGLLFAVAMFFSPIAALIPSCAYAAALIYVGIMMMGCLGELNWKDPADVLPSFMTLIMMPFSYNISFGIAFGLMSYVAVKLLTGKAKEINAGTWIMSLLFAAMFFLTH